MARRAVKIARREASRPTVCGWTLCNTTNRDTNRIQSRWATVSFWNAIGSPACNMYRAIWLAPTSTRQELRFFWTGHHLVSGRVCVSHRAVDAFEAIGDRLGDPRSRHGVLIEAPNKPFHTESQAARLLNSMAFAAAR